MQFQTRREPSLLGVGVVLTPFRAQQLGGAIIQRVKYNHSLVMQALLTPESLHSLPSVDPYDRRSPSDSAKVAALKAFVDRLNSLFVDLNAFKNTGMRFPHLQFSDDKGFVEFLTSPQTQRRFSTVIGEFISTIRPTNVLGDMDRLENFYRRCLFFKRSAERVTELGSKRVSASMLQREYGGIQKFRPSKLKPGRLLL